MAIKMELVQSLIIEEIIRKRDINIRAFRKGLFILGFCQDHPCLTKQLFVYRKEELIANKFLALLEPGSPPISPLSLAAYSVMCQLPTVTNYRKSRANYRHIVYVWSTDKFT